MVKYSHCNRTYPRKVEQFHESSVCRVLAERRPRRHRVRDERADSDLLAQDQGPERLPSFEVASVKENVSGDSRSPMRTQPGGRFVATNVLLKFLIAEAFSDPQPVHLSSRILGGPDWINSARYDINAKASAEFRPSPDGPPRELLLMLRSLLQERFKVRTHYETREL